MPSSDRVFILLLGHTFVLDLGSHDLVVNCGLEFCENTRLLQRESVGALEGTFTARVDVGELNTGVSNSASELSFDIDFGQGEQHSFLRYLSVEEVPPAALFVLAGFGCDKHFSLFYLSFNHNVRCFDVF